MLKYIAATCRNCYMYSTHVSLLKELNALGCGDIMGDTHGCQNAMHVEAQTKWAQVSGN
jgi:hypothetical protein